jgi:ABC-type transport system substrate-binding protein
VSAQKPARRWIGAVTGAVVAAAMTLGGMGTASAATTVVTVPMPPMSTLDPIVNAVSTVVDQGVVFEGLYGYSLNNQLEPKIAKSYTVSDGGRVWTFTLRRNARWSNGQPVTAEDFYYAWLRIDSPQDVAGAVWNSVMTYVLGAYRYRAGIIPASEVGLKVLGPYKIQITLKAPHNILGILAEAGSMPVYPPDVQAHPTTWWMPQDFVGDGPYVPSSFVTNGEITLVRNPYYVGAPGEYNVGNVDQINIIPAPTTMVEDYESHAINLAWITNPSDYKYILSNPTLRSQVHVAGTYQMTSLDWDRSPMPSPLDNLKVRQAIAMAIDRTPIVKDVLQGMAGAATAYGPASWAPTRYEHALPYNVAEARKLLAEAGYPGGKGFPTLALYCKTLQSNPAAIPVAEAIAQELKQALGINFKIEPTNDSILNAIVYNGLEPDVAPGYVLAGGNAGWIDTVYLPMQANQLVHYDGALGNLAFRQHAEDWYFYTYDPREVAQWGNPNDPSMGVSFSQWKPLEQAAMRDIAYLNAWIAKQPKWYQALLSPPGTPSLMDTWNTIVDQWKSATTPAAKHQAWVTAWKFVGTVGLGNGNAAYGLNAQVYTDEHEGPVLYRLNMEDALLGSETSLAAADKLAAQIVNTIMDQGWDIPLYYGYNIYLANPNITDVDANPFGWTWWGNLQYLQVK